MGTTKYSAECKWLDLDRIPVIYDMLAGWKTLKTFCITSSQCHVDLLRFE